MFEAKIYIVWRSAKGGKDIVAIFAEKIEALHNASIWQKEAKDMGYNWNYRVKENTIYGSKYPILCK